MKKNKFTSLAKKIKYIAVGFILIALLLPFTNGLKMTVSSGTGDVVTTYKSAFAFMFGGKLVSERVSYKAISVSVLPLIGYLIIMIAFLLLITAVFIKNNKSVINSITTAGSFSLLIVGSIILLSAHRSAATVLSSAILGSHSSSVANTIYKNTTLGFGFWGTALFGILSALLLFVSLLFDGTIDKVRSLFK